MDLAKYRHKIFSKSVPDFETVALEVFRFQYDNNPVYHDYMSALHVDPSRIGSITGIPFLPIRFFKSHTVMTTRFTPATTFESSGTTGAVNSRHIIKDLSLYENSFTAGFSRVYGPVSDWCVIGLLPSYIEKGNSSLVYMVNELVNQSHHPQSGFYLNEFDKLSRTLMKLEAEKQKTILFGVSFALLDFAASHPLPLKHTIIMETGGMKGRREEMIRAELHEILKRSFDLPAIHSEYGMTELLSQAYSEGNGIFHCPPWMRVLIRDEEDPLAVVSHLPIAIGTAVGSPRSGGINIIDLANIYSCSFIATDDGGKLHGDGSFEVLGRIDNSDVRGCSLMVI